MTYETILYDTDRAIATITLNRPQRLNSIVPQMVDDLDAAVREASRDPDVRVIVLRGAGRAFCAGFDFGQEFSSGYGTLLYTDGKWDPGKDMIGTTSGLAAPVPRFMSVWRSPKPVIAQVHGWCVGGGSDMALCADLVVASEDAQIGTPYARVWGCYLTGMWIYRLSLARCKWHALTGEPLSGKEAAEIELINRAVPFDALETTVRALAEKLAGLPPSQLAAMKLIVNQAYENMGLASTQLLGPILDGYMRNTPEALRFIDVAAQRGVGSAIEERDGPFGDYSRASAERKPNPRNVITPTEVTGPSDDMPDRADFDGCVIGESLKDPTIVNRWRVWRAWIVPDELVSDHDGTMARWHIYWISCGAAEVDRLEAELKPWRWYAHFWRGDRMIVIFHDARFEMSRADRSTWTAAIDHGKAKGIPDDQLDFLILPHERPTPPR